MSRLAWYLIQHYQRVHGMKMYSTCLNENSSMLNAISSTASQSSTSSESSMLNIDLALFEAALKDVTSSNRSLTSSTTFASNQLIAAANAARSVQQQQQQSSSLRATSTSADRSVLPGGASSKAGAPSSGLVSSMQHSLYPSLLQEVTHRSSSIVKLLEEAAKQEACQTCGKDTNTNDTVSLADTPFLTPKAVDITTSRVCVFLLMLLVPMSLMIFSFDSILGWKSFEQYCA